MQVYVLFGFYLHEDFVFTPLLRVWSWGLCHQQDAHTASSKYHKHGVKHICSTIQKAGPVLIQYQLGVRLFRAGGSREWVEQDRERKDLTLEGGGGGAAVLQWPVEMGRPPAIFQRPQDSVLTISVPLEHWLLPGSRLGCLSFYSLPQGVWQIMIGEDVQGAMLYFFDNV